MTTTTGIHDFDLAPTMGEHLIGEQEAHLLASTSMDAVVADLEEHYADLALQERSVARHHRMTRRMMK